MPELPEVETVVRTLRPQVLECCIERVEVLRERSLHPLSLPVERLAGTRISAARRRGKLALLDGLAQRGVKATFFLVGEQVADHQDTVRRMADEGH